MFLLTLSFKYYRNLDKVLRNYDFLGIFENSALNKICSGLRYEQNACFICLGELSNLILNLTCTYNWRTVKNFWNNVEQKVFKNTESFFLF